MLKHLLILLFAAALTSLSATAYAVVDCSSGYCVAMPEHRLSPAQRAAKSKCQACMRIIRNQCRTDCDKDYNRRRYSMTCWRILPWKSRACQIDLRLNWQMCRSTCTDVYSANIELCNDPANFSPNNVTDSKYGNCVATPVVAPPTPTPTPRPTPANAQ